MDFANGLYYPSPVSSLLTTTRASNETSLLPSSASGASYLTFGSNAPAVVPGVGLQVHLTATNQLLNSTAPVTQTTASLGTGTYTLWVNGSGSATSSAGTAVGSGFGAATNGTPNTFTLTGAGTVTVTVSGSLNTFQLESGSYGSPFIVTAGVTATRAADRIMLPIGFYNGVAGTIYAQFVSRPVTTVGGIIAINDNTSSNRIDLRTNQGSLISSFVSVGGVNKAVLSMGPATASAAVKAAIAFNVGTMGIASNGTLGTGGTPNALPTATQILLGDIDNGGSQLGNVIKRLAIWPTKLSDAAITALTK